MEFKKKKTYLNTLSLDQLLLGKRLIHLGIIIFLMTISTLSYSDSIESEVLKIGVLSFEEKEDTIQKWTPLIEYLGQTLPKYEFKLIPLYYEEMNKAVYDSEIDFVLTNPGHFIELRTASNISRAIATLIELDNGIPQSEFGGVIFTRGDNNSIDSLADIKGKRISAVSKSSLGGYQASAYELVKVGISLEKDVEFIYTGMPHKNAIESVLSASSDVGFVRTGVIEGLVAEGSIDLDDLKIINLTKKDGFTDYLSTELYPEWPFSVLSHIDMDIYREVAFALLMLEFGSEEASAMDIYGFNIPSSYLVVEEMMRELRLPPFDKSSKLTLEEVWNSYRIYMVLFLLALVVAVTVAILKIITGREIRRKNRELQKLTDELNEVSIRDSLTKVYNRRYFEMFFKEKVSLARRSNSYIGLLLIDVDLFKYVNDTYGHAMGDEVLKKIASTISEQLMRATDFVIRYGGDEFVVLLYDTDMEGTVEVANKIHNAVGSISLHCKALKRDVSVTVSIGGVSLSPKSDECCEEILEKADEAMYRAKDRGRNQINVIDMGIE